MQASRDADLATFVVAFNMQPSEYWQLTMNQRNEIVSRANKRKH